MLVSSYIIAKSEYEPANCWRKDAGKQPPNCGLPERCNLFRPLMRDNAEGTVPLRPLNDRPRFSKAVKALKLVGIGPLNLFSHKCKTRNLVKLLRSGMVPLSAFIESSKFSNAVKALKLAGMNPRSLFWYKYKTRMLVRLPHDVGMLPVMEFLDIRMSSNCCKRDQSAGIVPLIPRWSPIVILVKLARPWNASAHGRVPCIPLDQRDIEYTLPILHLTPRHVQ